MKSHELEGKFGEKQAKPLKIALDAYNKFYRQTFMRMCTRSPLELGILKTEMGKRDSSA